MPELDTPAIGKGHIEFNIYHKLKEVKWLLLFLGHHDEHIV